MPHVENTGYIGWGNNDRVAFPVALFGCGKELFFLPEIIPPSFNFVGFIAFI
jgi:hypothetical protein